MAGLIIVPITLLFEMQVPVDDLDEALWIAEWEKEHGAG